MATLSKRHSPVETMLAKEMMLVEDSSDSLPIPLLIESSTACSHLTGGQEVKFQEIKSFPNFLIMKNGQKSSNLMIKNLKHYSNF